MAAQSYLEKVDTRKLQQQQDLASTQQVETAVKSRIQIIVQISQQNLARRQARLMLRYQLADQCMIIIGS